MGLKTAGFDERLAKGRLPGNRRGTGADRSLKPTARGTCAYGRQMPLAVEALFSTLVEKVLGELGHWGIEPQRKADQA